MVILTLLVIVHEYFASSIVPYHKLRYDTALAQGKLIEILAELTVLIDERTGK